MTAVTSGTVAFNVVSNLPSWMPAINQWVQISTANTIASQVPSPLPPGVLGARGVVDAWGCIAVDPTNSDVYLWGGGHNDYAGNEVYCLHLGLDSPTWERVSSPSPTIQTGVQYQPDGQPTARHTYNSFWVSDRKLKSLGGASIYNTAGNLATNFDFFDLSTRTWDTQISASGANWWVSGDHATGDIYCVKVGPTSNTQYSRLAPDNTLSLLGYASLNPGTFGSAVYDAGRQRIWRIGSYSGGVRADYWQVGGSAVDPALTGSAASTFDNAGAYPGVDYDSENEWILYKASTGATVYRLDCATLVCDTLSTSGSVANAIQGVNGRFKYVPALGGFIYVPSWGVAYFLRTS